MRLLLKRDQWGKEAPMLYCRVGVQAPRGLPNTTLLGSMRGTLEPPGAGGKLAPPLASPDSMERGRGTTLSLGGGVQVQAPFGPL